VGLRGPNRRLVAKSKFCKMVSSDIEQYYIVNETRQIQIIVRLVQKLKYPSDFAPARNGPKISVLFAQLFRVLCVSRCLTFAA
jgi:hypothetical protein